MESLYFNRLHGEVPIAGMARKKGRIRPEQKYTLELGNSIWATYHRSDSMPYMLEHTLAP